jgi:hypothetical protein
LTFADVIDNVMCFEGKSSRRISMKLGKECYSQAFVLLLLAFSFLPWAPQSVHAEAETGAAIAGQVIFEGTAPPGEPITMDADPICLLVHQEPFYMQEGLVNENGTLRNVFVYVKQGLENQAFEAPKEPVVFDQKGCWYDPHVFGIRVRQPLEILNSDDTLHNVHALPANSTEFNLGMPIKGMKLTKSFSAPEVMVKIKCEVHPWMSAYAGVVNHPFFGVTGTDGAFNLSGLPAGQYVVEAWHEQYGALTPEVTVAAGEKKDIVFSFKA